MSKYGITGVLWLIAANTASYKPLAISCLLISIFFQVIEVSKILREGL